MRTSRTLSVSMPPAQLKQAERLARKENRTLSELVREALRQYQQKQESSVNTELIAALKAVQQDAVRAGLDKLSLPAINSEIAAFRRERRRKTTKQPTG
jgi:metal-responsive CopG/Arc/MetJ family transcriptional regulator